VGDARRNTDFDGARVAVLLDRQPPGRAVIRILERELDFLLHVAPGARAARPAAPPPRALAGAAKERLEEVGKRVLVAEHLAHLIFGHRPEAAALRAAAAAEMHVPAAELRRIEPGAAGAGLFVSPPVGAELVVLLPLCRVAQDLVGLVDFLEAGFGGLVPRVHVGVMLPRQLAVGLL